MFKSLNQITQSRHFGTTQLCRKVDLYICAVQMFQGFGRISQPIRWLKRTVSQDVVEIRPWSGKLFSLHIFIQIFSHSIGKSNTEKQKRKSSSVSGYLTNFLRIYSSFNTFLLYSLRIIKFYTLKKS
jgi:hypothetical protein